MPELAWQNGVPIWKGVQARTRCSHQGQGIFTEDESAATWRTSAEVPSGGKKGAVRSRVIRQRDALGRIQK